MSRALILFNQIKQSFEGEKYKSVIKNITFLEDSSKIEIKIFIDPAIIILYKLEGKSPTDQLELDHEIFYLCFSKVKSLYSHYPLKNIVYNYDEIDTCISLTIQKLV